MVWTPRQDKGEIVPWLLDDPSVHYTTACYCVYTRQPTAIYIFIYIYKIAQCVYIYRLWGTSQRGWWNGRGVEPCHWFINDEIGWHKRLRPRPVANGCWGVRGGQSVEKALSRFCHSALLSLARRHSGSSTSIHLLWWIASQPHQQQIGTGI